MSVYDAVNPSEIVEGAPFKQTLVERLDENPKSVFQGDPTARAAGHTLEISMDGGAIDNLITDQASGSFIVHGGADEKCKLGTTLQPQLIISGEHNFSSTAVDIIVASVAISDETYYRFDIDCMVSNIDIILDYNENNNRRYYMARGFGFINNGVIVSQSWSFGFNDATSISSVSQYAIAQMNGTTTFEIKMSSPVTYSSDASMSVLGMVI